MHFLDLLTAYISSCGNCPFLPILPRSEESFSVSAVGLEQFEIHHSHSSYKVMLAISILKLEPVSGRLTLVRKLQGREEEREAGRED